MFEEMHLKGIKPGKETLESWKSMVKEHSQKFRGELQKAHKIPYKTWESFDIRVHLIVLNSVKNVTSDEFIFYFGCLM